MEFPILSTILLLPLVAAVVMSFLPRDAVDKIHYLSAGTMIVVLALTLCVYVNFDTAVGGMQFVERIPWITDLGVCYSVGVDGISLPMLLLTEVVGLAAVYSSWQITKRVKEFFMLLMVLIPGVTGTFIACDLFIFLLCYEVVVIPIYLMIMIWGSTIRLPKENAGMKLTMYLLMGSAFMLVGVVAIYLTAFPAGMRTFDMAALSAAGQAGAFPAQFQIIMFFLFILGFGTLLSMFPFHSWSPDGHASAPTAVSMVHASVLKKIGAYGLIRLGILVLPIGAKFWAPLLACFAMCSVTYAAYIAIVQKDLKYIIGYSSVSHLGYILLGISALNIVGIEGAIANMVAHGMMASLFFSQAGYIYERTHLRSIPELAGLAHHLPRLTVGFMLAGMASVGLPGLIGFVPEFTIFVGTLPVYPVFAVLAIAGIIFTALYVLRMLAQVLFGPRVERFAGVPDEAGPHLVPLLLLGAFILGFGIFPDTLMCVIRAGVTPMEPILQSIEHVPTMLGGGF